jgi:hypothetical protein
MPDGVSEVEHTSDAERTVASSKGQERKRELEIEIDESWTRREWTVERAGWLLMLLILVAGLLGAFGEGRLSRGEASQYGLPLRVDYERVARHGSPATLEIALGPGAAPGGVARLWVDRKYAEAVEVKYILPEPESTWVTRDRLGFAVRVPNPADSAFVTIAFEPDDIGSREVRVGLEGHPGVRFRQLVLP